MRANSNINNTSFERYNGPPPARDARFQTSPNLMTSFVNLMRDLGSGLSKSPPENQAARFNVEMLRILEQLNQQISQLDARLNKGLRASEASTKIVEGGLIQRMATLEAEVKTLKGVVGELKAGECTPMDTPRSGVYSLMETTPSVLSVITDK